MKQIEITKQLVKDHNLTEGEYAKVLEILGRVPTITELGIFSAMWSEYWFLNHKMVFRAMR